MLSSLKQNEAEANSIVTTLRRFISLSKENSEQSDERQYFEDLCCIINANLHKLTTFEAMEVLKILSGMRIPNSSNLTYIILKLINISLDDLTFLDICNLASLMKKMPSDKLYKNIQTALIRKFLMKFSTEFRGNDIDHLDAALSFVNNNLKDNKLQDILINRLQKYEDEIPLHKTVSILASLYTIKYYPKGWLDVLHRVEDDILMNLGQLTDGQVDHILHSMAARLKFDKYVKYNT